MSALPDSMAAVRIRQFGGPEMLELQQRPLPVPGTGEVLVKVLAAGVNRPDISQRKGNYPPPPGAPDVPGLEICGDVVGLGPGAGRWAIGDRVMALVIGGGYAEYCTAHESHALPASKLDPVLAAAVPETFFTVWHNVFERGGLKSGETLLLHGGTSGIGTTAIQLARHFGAKVIVTAGSDDKCAAARQLGADLAINYRAGDFVKETLAATGGRGADVILDMVGGDYVQRNYDAAAIDGRIVQIATIASPAATIDLRRIVSKRLCHTGSALRPRSAETKAAIAASIAQKVLPLLESGKIKPVLDSTFPLAEAAKAHARMESSVHIGKIILIV